MQMNHCVPCHFEKFIIISKLPFPTFTNYVSLDWKPSFLQIHLYRVFIFSSLFSIYFFLFDSTNYKELSTLSLLNQDDGLSTLSVSLTKQEIWAPSWSNREEWTGQQSDRWVFPWTSTRWYHIYFWIPLLWKLFLLLSLPWDVAEQITSLLGLTYLLLWILDQDIYYLCLCCN